MRQYHENFKSELGISTGEFEIENDHTSPISNPIKKADNLHSVRVSTPEKRLPKKLKLRSILEGRGKQEMKNNQQSSSIQAEEVRRPQIS